MVRSLDCQIPLSEQCLEWGRQHQTRRVGSILRNGIKKIIQAGRVFDLRSDSAASQEAPGSPVWRSMGCVVKQKKVCAGACRPQKLRSGICRALCCGLPPFSLCHDFMEDQYTFISGVLIMFCFVFPPPKAAWSAATATSPALPTSMWREI